LQTLVITHGRRLHNSTVFGYLQDQTRPMYGVRALSSVPMGLTYNDKVRVGVS